jgi:hypothetical protein
LGRDRGDHPDRVAADHRGVAGHVLAGDGAVLAAHRAGEEAPAVGDRRDLVALHGVDRLAAVQRLKRREVVALRLDAVGDAQERCRALGRGGARPAVERPARGGDCRLDLLDRRLRHLEDRRAGARVQHRLGRALPRLAPVADQEFGLHHVSPQVICRRRRSRRRRA